MTTVLFVGAGRHQRRAIEQARARGLRVAAVDRNADAPGLAAADLAEVVDFTDASAVVEVARRIGVDGVLTVSADRAVPVVAAVAEELGLPGIGTGTAHLLTHKRAMRDALGAADLPQPPYASLRSAADIDDALTEVRLPAVLKPVDSGGQRAVFRIEARDELERDLAEAIAESPTRATTIPFISTPSTNSSRSASSVRDSAIASARSRSSSTLASMRKTAR